MIVQYDKNPNSVQEEIKSRLKSGNACYHSVQNVLSSCLLSKYLKDKMYRNIILLVVLCGCGTWSLILWDELGWGYLIKVDKQNLTFFFGPRT